MFLLSSDAFDNELIVKTLKEITEGKTVQIPVYDFVSHSRSNSCSCLAVPLLTSRGSPAFPKLLPSAWVLTCQHKVSILTTPAPG